ncbi:hypothetical protein EIN_441950 [Entamoeba invadens IP1]|uniref:EGF-like domain-containing protein n=1 Tax=Entamoeba invadens IP1 TaxID=370355 RepID=A0A0A1UB72_ENTIV|nr:hypothetical protein EIN_441950 [Entamoeba invadens IP1]ELP92365.1 hypothetical protein EIN_441950 [Entamoeba invadens IP1]|eukprot:XP_004259136.1 hypothetical protein EIN_441950 [Entamoeba invadens IP1]
MCVSCKKKIHNYEKCNSDNVDTQCLLCSNGFYSNGPQCVKCDTSCGDEGCVNGKCTNCKDNKILDKSGKCVEPTNCDSVDNSKCAVCKDGYYLYNNICVQKASNTPCNSIQITEDVCIGKEDAGCDEVLNGKCASCQSELILDNGMCKSCSSSIQNCTSCSTSSTESIMCSVCREGFFPEKTCKSCKMIYGCELCVNLLVGNVESTRICTKCLSGYYLQDGECLQIKNCVANTENECTKCEQNYIIEEDERKEYTTQLGCIATDGVFCTTCSDGFYLSPESRRYGKCERCGIVGCSLCNSTGSDCLSCDKTHFSTALPTSQCTECTTITIGCLECTSEHCTKCQDGYFIDATDHKCNSCKMIEGCTTCSLETGKCFKCLDGFYLVSGQCALCNNTIQKCGRCSSDSNCNSCKEGYFLEENMCHKCSEIDGCEICDESSRLCFKCKDYYTGLIDGNGYKCVDCETTHENCSSCSVDGNCTECKSSHMLKEGVCVECSTSNPNCHVCATTSSRCLSCGVGYGVDKNGQCQKCIDVNCLDCELYDKCSKCKEDTILTDGSCVSCSVDNCKTCDLNGFCVECKSSYYPNDGVCQSYDLSSLNCVETSTTRNECLKCNINYYLKLGKCYPCNLFDANCVECNYSTCLKCSEGTYPNGVGKYCTVDGCVKCKTKTSGSNVYPVCEICAPGYNLNLNDEFCYQNTIDNCEEYETNTNTCLKCKNGFALDGTTCQSCSNTLTNCEECASTSSCTTCSEGFTVGTDNTCHTCSDVMPNCDKCYSDTSKCKECAVGYYVTEDLTCSSCDSVISNCSECYNLGGVKCTKCNFESYIENGKCVEVKANEFKTSETTSKECRLQIQNCYSCNYTTSDTIFDTTAVECNRCLDGYGFVSSTTRVCEICHNEVDSSSVCITCENGCKRCFIKDNPTKEQSCVECEDGFALRNGKCPKIENREYCLDELHNVGCESCANYYSTVEIGTKCSPNNRNANCSFYNEKGECFEYNAKPKVSSSIKTEDASDVNCQEGEYQKGHCRCELCREGFVFDASNECKENSIANCLNENSNKCVRCLPTTLLGISNSETVCSKSATINNCEILSSTGCVKCESGYYMDGIECERCDKNCEQCDTNATTCISCYFGYKISCAKFLSDGGCAICQNGYYWQGRNCYKCGNNCTTCSQSEGNCLAYNIDNGFYQNDTNGIYCISVKELANCLKYDIFGCVQCENGYFLDRGKCEICAKNCELCVSSDFCQNCVDDYILTNRKCEYYTNIKYCASATNGLCSSCSPKYDLSIDKLSCIKHQNKALSIALPVVITVIIIIVLIVTLFVVCLLYTSHKLK